MSSTELDFASLEKSFDLDLLPTDVQSDNQISLIENTEDRDREQDAQDLGSPENMIRMNIERANHFLNLMEDEFKKGGAFNSRMLEAASRLISEVTVAATSLKGLEVQDQNLDMKQKTLDLKEFEVKNKIESKQNAEIEKQNSSVVNNTVVFADRESLLKMLNKQNDDSDDFSNTINI